MAGTNTPNLNLYKPNRTDNVSVIADLNDNMDKIDTFAGNVATAESNSKGTVAIVEDGNTCTHVGGIASGQYVVWKGLLYKATQAISVGTTLSTSTNLSAVTDGIANELNSKITTNTIGTRIDLLSYTDSNNPYTFPSDGYVFLNNASGKNGLLTIRDSNNNTQNTFSIGNAEGRYSVFVRKGMKCYLTYSASNLYFCPFE